MAPARRLRGGADRGVLPWAGPFGGAGQGCVPGLPGDGRVPRVRAGNLRPQGHMGRAGRGGAPPTAAPARWRCGPPAASGTACLASSPAATRPALPGPGRAQRQSGALGPRGLVSGYPHGGRHGGPVAGRDGRRAQGPMAVRGSRRRRRQRAVGTVRAGAGRRGLYRDRQLMLFHQAHRFELGPNDVVRQPRDEPKRGSSATRLTTSRSGRRVPGR